MKYDAIILAGGKGTRVKKFTKKNPKCLIKINGKPFLYYQLKYLKKNNIKNVIISVGYLSNKIRDYLNKNINFINFKIIDDGKKLLGTGGAVLKSLKFLKNNFYVMYGDSYLTLNLKNFKKPKNFSSMAIFKNDNKFDKSNIELLNSKKIIYHLKKSKKKLRYIDYGISFLNKKIFKNKKKGVKFNLPEFYNELSLKNLLLGYKVKTRFYEIGSYRGIKELNNFLK